MLRYLIVKVDNMQEQKGYISREMKILRQIKRKHQELKTLEQKLKNAFNGLISKLDMAETISEIKGASIETSKTAKRKENLKRKQNTILKNYWIVLKGITYI